MGNLLSNYCRKSSFDKVNNLALTMLLLLDHITKKNEESYGELRWDEQFRQELEAENNNINGPKFDWETFKYACEQLQMDGILEQSNLHNSNLLFIYW